MRAAGRGAGERRQRGWGTSATPDTTADDTTSSTASNTAATSVDETGVDTGIGSTSSMPASTSGQISELVTWDSTTIICNDDGTSHVLVEAVLDLDIEGCSPPPDIDASQYILVSIPNWDGFQIDFVVGEDGVNATLGEQVLEGTFTLDLWAPTHPRNIIFDAKSVTTALQGEMYIEDCLLENEAPCFATEESG